MNMSISKTICNALTVDVEDYFHVSAFDHRVCRSTWDKFECRIEHSTTRLLDIFDNHAVQGTFFVLGWVADRYPKLIKRIASAGHEIASHGYWHQLVYEQTPESFVKDITHSRDAIANACSIEVTSYRAPSFSIVENSLWALDVLVEQGFTVDSSIFPIGGHDRYGLPGAAKEIHQRPTSCGSICEFPPSAWTRGRMSIPIGGGYFRLFPLSLTLKAIAAVRRCGRPAMFYIHPWEIDPLQPRVKRLGVKTVFRHYVGLTKTERRLRRLLQTVSFDRMDRVIDSVQSADADVLSPLTVY
jgi:polysaccharide deacetylase family protein (PEP-CTERM system associated)